MNGAGRIRAGGAPAVMVRRWAWTIIASTISTAAGIMVPAAPARISVRAAMTVAILARAIASMARKAVRPTMGRTTSRDRKAVLSRRRPRATRRRAIPGGASTPGSDSSSAGLSRMAHRRRRRKPRLRLPHRHRLARPAAAVTAAIVAVRRSRKASCLSKAPASPPGLFDIGGRGQDVNKFLMPRGDAPERLTFSGPPCGHSIGLVANLMVNSLETGGAANWRP
jgi:hypothetical protein